MMKRVFLLAVFMVVMFSLKSQMTFQSENVKLYFTFDSISNVIHLHITNLSDKIMYLNSTRTGEYVNYMSNNILKGGYRICMCIEGHRVDLARPSEGDRLSFNRILSKSTYELDVCCSDKSKKIKSSVFKLLFTLEYLLLSEDQYIEDMMRNEDLMKYLKEHHYKIHEIEIEGTMSFE